MEKKVAGIGIMKLSKLELGFLIGIILLGSFLRLYRIRDTAMFLGDQGRDAIIVKNIIKHGDVALIGPVTSVGNMYLGPFYYYFMAPWLALSYPDPLGPVIAVAMLGILTIPLIYFITKKIFGLWPAIFASSIFAVSTIAVEQVRFSWNPNIAPTVGLLIFYCAYQLLQTKKLNYILWLAILFSIIAQLHYMALLLAVFIITTVIILFVREKKSRREIIGYTLAGILIFIISLTPLYFFDRRHDHLIINSFKTFFDSPEEHLLPAQKLLQIAAHFSGSLFKLIPQMVGSHLQTTHYIFTVLVGIATFYIYKSQSKSQKQATILFVVWFIAAAVMMSLYSSSIFVHYLSFSQPVSLMFIGVLAGSLFQRFGFQIKAILLGCLALFMVTNIKHSPAFAFGLSSMEKAKITSQTIYDRVTAGEKYNIVLISGTGDIDAQNYRYFLETTDRPPVQAEQRGDVETLFIIQEDYFDKRVVDSPIYEIVVFPNKTPTEVYTIENGPTITVLRKNAQ